VSLDFTNAAIPTVLQAIGSAGGFQFIFDEKFDSEATTSVTLSDLSVLNALRFVLRSNELFYVVRSPRTVLVAPDTRQKRQEYMPQGMRTFRLEHADPRNVIVVLRSLLQTRQLHYDERLNTVMMTDTIGQLEIAEELIDRMDRESGKDTEPIWVGSDFCQDMRSKGDPIPRLAVDLGQTVTLDPDQATIRSLYGALGEAAGVQFAFSRQIDLDQAAPFAVPEMSAREALDFVTLRLEHFSVIWGPRTIFISPDADSRRMVEEHVAIQFFYLTHAERKTVITALRSQLQTRQLAEVPSLNAVVMRDNLAKLSKARDLIEGMDR